MTTALYIAVRPPVLEPASNSLIPVYVVTTTAPPETPVPPTSVLEVSPTSEVVATITTTIPLLLGFDFPGDPAI